MYWSKEKINSLAMPLPRFELGSPPPQGDILSIKLQGLTATVININILNQ